MITELSHFCLILSLSMGILPWFFSEKEGFLRYASYSQSLLLLGAFFGLIKAFACSDFSIHVVATHSHSTMPLAYKIAATWGHHEGSMLLWCLLLSGYVSLFSWNRQRIPTVTMAKALLHAQLILQLFLIYVIFFSNPFERLMPFPINQGELNPLLQDPSLTFHPIFLYLGFIGFSIPFVLSLQKAHLTKLIEWSKPWTFLSWGFLTLGITSGSWWAYYELGWGGWWFWDPVENASLLPWLCATALLHAFKAPSERKIRALSSASFLLCLAGLWVIRGGALISVHNFSLSPGRSLFLICILTINSVLALRIVFRSEAAITKSSRLLKIAVVFFCYLIFIILWSIFFPIGYEKFTQNPITLSPEYFATLFCYPSIALLAIMGIAPEKISKKAIISLVLSSVITATVWVKYRSPPNALFALFGSSFLIIQTLLIGAKQWQKKGPMMLAHLGIGILALGVTINQFWQQETIVQLKVGESFTLQGMTITFEKLQRLPAKNHIAHQGTFSLKTPSSYETLKPERRIYFATQVEHSESAIKLLGLKNLSIILGETQDQQTWTVRAYYNPYIALIWIGGVIIALSAFAFLWRRKLFLLPAILITSINPCYALKEYHPHAISLFKKFKCPTCHGQTIDASTTTLSENMREDVDRLVREKNSDEQIKSIIGKKYDSQALNQKTRLWPPVLLFLVLLLITYLARYPRRRK